MHALFVPVWYSPSDRNVQSKAESLDPQKIVEDIERLVRLAYPEAAESMVEVLAKD